MAEQVLTNVGLWIDGRDFAGVSNQVGIEATADTPEKTNFKSAWRERAAGGLKSSSFSLEGYFDTDDFDEAQLEGLAKEGSAMIAPAGMSPGELAYIVPYVESAYSNSGSIGELLAFSMAAEGDGAPHRASVFEIRENIVGTIGGAFRTLAPIPAGEELIVWVHVKSNGGGHMNLEVRSRPSVGVGTQTQRAIRLGITETGLYEFRVHGPISDLAWHLVYALAGGPPNTDFDVASALNTAPITVVPAPVITPPTPMTHALLGGLSFDPVPISSEINIDPVSGHPGRINYGTLTSRHVLVARDASQADITSIMIHGDPTMANQIAGFGKYATVVNVSGTNYNVWVSHQMLTYSTDFVLDIS